jgi:hypothetical protein
MQSDGTELKYLSQHAMRVMMSWKQLSHLIQLNTCCCRTADKWG